MTKKNGVSADNDPNLSPLMNADCKTVCVVGKTWDFHVKTALGIKNDENLIKGCQSKVWLNADFKDGKINFIADSEAIITKGIIAILLMVFNNKTPDEIIKSDVSFIEKIGLKEHLSPNRANGLYSMIKQIKFYAIAYNKK